MENVLPENCAKQWEVLLLLIASEEKKIDRTNDNEVDTMHYFLNNEGVKQILLQWLRQMRGTYARKRSESDTALKCDEVSLWWRQQGNDKFRANNLQESYKCYTNSVLYAHQNGPKYPLALANRSAALLRLKRFEECLSNVDLAISAGYPADLRYKLLLRRADCFIELNKPNKAREALNSALEEANQFKLTAAHAAEFERHTKVLKKKLEMIKIQEPEEEPNVLPDFYKGENPDLAAASSVLELRRSETVGRHVVTRETLRRGDIVFSEEPYAWVALPSEVAVCDGCCALDINLVPCGQCSRVVYCGVECRARASALHRWECPGAQADLFVTIGIAHLALRVLLMSTVTGFPPVPAECSASAADLFRSYAQVDDIDIYKKDTPAFYRMFNLVTNFEKMNNMDYIQYALTATMLTLYLEHFTRYLDTLRTALPRTLSAPELRVFAGALVLRALGQLVCNGHAALTLATVDDENGATVSEREVRRATAIYPSAAMMNHSCDPNIINTFYKARLIVRCSREIPEGSQVLNCYGPHRARETTARRRQLLRQQYLFTCNCSACLDMERRDSVLLFSAYACPSCKGPMVRGGRRRPVCPHCRTPFQPQRAANIIDQAEGLLAQAERASSKQERIEKTHAAFRLKQQAWYRHNASLRTAADHLARLYADNGDYSKSVELIKQNIQSLEYQFGSFSVEVAHELRKLSDVMLERIIKSSLNPDYRDWCLETHKIVKKASQLMELNYGAWEAVVKRLRDQERLVAVLVADSRSPDATDDVHHTLHYNLKI